MTLEPERQEFLDAELFQLTLAAVSQRGAVYRPTLREEQRRPLHKTLRELLSALSPQYVNGAVSEERHAANIEHIAKTVTTRHGDVLHNGSFRIGNAQKALNLHLKYLWCRNQIPTPPHCPFDARILAKIPGWKTRRWTRLDSIDEYKQLVAAAQSAVVAAGKSSLAEWELAVYNQVMKS
jgi:hypothetical protein